MEKYWFGVDGNKGLLLDPSYDLKKDIRDEEIIKTKGLLHNDGLIIVLYEKIEFSADDQDFSVQPLVFKVDAVRGCATPSYRLGVKKSFEEQRDLASSYLINAEKRSAERLIEGRRVNIKLYHLTSEDENILEEKILTLIKTKKEREQKRFQENSYDWLMRSE
ncbi:MAG: hypothetical protein KKA62_00380 [Nanoarchaeota archaeon]|nr:hypothetical protein [Nanoarchaeota archaeon]